MKQKQYTDILRFTLFNLIFFHLISKTQNIVIPPTEGVKVRENHCGWQAKDLMGNSELGTVITAHDLGNLKSHIT
jgi:hypothetical protein